MVTAFANMSTKMGRTTFDYIIRFNAVASLAFKSVEWVEVSKTKDGKYIILTPTTEPLPGERRSVGHIDWDGGYVRLFANYMVKHEQFLRASWFDNQRHKVKKDKKGNIYICLWEVIESDGRGHIGSEIQS